MARRNKFQGQKAVAPAHLTNPRGVGSHNGINAQRQRWATIGMHNDDGSFTSAYIQYSEEMDLCYKLVAMGSYILKKPHLRLITGGANNGIVSAATDGKNIFLPKMHPNRIIATKHELSHLYFKSNIPLRLKFVKKLIADIEKEAGLDLSFAREKLTEDMCFFINVIDDVRVNSLWGVLYPGDGDDMMSWYQGTIGPRMMEKANKEFRGDIPNLFTYAILIALGQDPKSSTWGEFEDDIHQLVDDVHYKTFSALLVLTERLLKRILRKITQELQPPQQGDPQADPQQDPGSGVPAPNSPQGGSADADNTDDAKGDASTSPEDKKEKDEDGKKDEKKEDKKKDPIAGEALWKLANQPRPSDKFPDDNAGFDYRQEVNDRDLNQLRTGAALRQIDKLDVDDDEAVAQFLRDSEGTGVKLARRIQKAMDKKSKSVMSGNFRSQNDYLTKDVKANLNIVRPDKRSLSPVILTPLETEVAERWRRYFLRIMGVLAMRTEEQGYELLTEIYIQQRAANEPYNCFRRDTSGRGFRLTLLIDMSGSMFSCFNSVSRLVAVLQRALDFPFVHLTIAGFNSNQKGRVDYYLYPAKTPGLVSPTSKVSGVTPLPHAIQVAGRGMLGTRDDSHLFVLSDGFPVYALSGNRGYLKTETLMEWTRDAVLTLRKQKVRVWCWMIGWSTPGTTSMDRMFGAKNWRKISEEQIYDDSFRFITERFLTYLRTR